MRVTPGTIHAKIASDLQRALGVILRKEGQLTSGRRINAPSDDPGGAAQAVMIRSRQAANEQFLKNIGAARTALATADATVQSAVDMFVRVKELAIQGASDTSDASARQALATEIDQLLESLVSVANSRDARGGMLFGGQESTVAPYTVTRDADGQITTVTENPRGIDGKVQVEITEGFTVEASVAGTAVFGAPADATYAFGALVTLRDDLEANDGAAVRAALDDLTALVDRATLASLTIGSRLGWITALEGRLQDESVTLVQTLSRVEDLDIIKAVQELKEVQGFYEAGLAAGARLIQQSLLNFLR